MSFHSVTHRLSHTANVHPSRAPVAGHLPDADAAAHALPPVSAGHLPRPNIQRPQMPGIAMRAATQAAGIAAAALLLIGIPQIATAQDSAAQPAAQPPAATQNVEDLPALPAEDAAAAESIRIDENDEAAQSLLANSPFMSKAFKERLAKSDTSRARELTFRGFAGIGDSWLVNVYNNKTKQSQWVKLGEQINGITIAEFDKEGLRIKIIKDATSIYLNLEQPQQ